MMLKLSDRFLNLDYIVEARVEPDGSVVYYTVDSRCEELTGSDAQRFITRLTLLSFPAKSRDQIEKEMMR